MIDKLRLRAEIFAEVINLVKEELLSNSCLILDIDCKQYYTGKKHALEKILTQIKFLERFPVSDHFPDVGEMVDNNEAE